MGVGIKVDEDLPLETAEVLRESGYDARTVLDQGWSGRDDSSLWRAVQEEGRWLITADKGFADIRQYRPGDHKGVVLLRLEHESRQGYVGLVRALVSKADLDALTGCVVIVTPAGMRVHRGD